MGAWEHVHVHLLGNTINTSRIRVLPDVPFFPIGQGWTIPGISGYSERVVVEMARKVAVVKMLIGINDGLDF